MIKVRLDEILNERGLTAYWLAKETGLALTAVYSIRHAKRKAIRYNTLNKLCRALNCTPA